MTNIQNKKTLRFPFFKGILFGTIILIFNSSMILAQETALVLGTTVPVTGNRGESPQKTAWLTEEFLLDSESVAGVHIVQPPAETGATSRVESPQRRAIPDTIPSTIVDQSHQRGIQSATPPKSAPSRAGSVSLQRNVIPNPPENIENFSSETNRRPAQTNNYTIPHSSNRSSSAKQLYRYDTTGQNPVPPTILTTNDFQASSGDYIPATSTGPFNSTFPANDSERPAPERTVPTMRPMPVVKNVQTINQRESQPSNQGVFRQGAPVQGRSNVDAFNPTDSVAGTASSGQTFPAETDTPRGREPSRMMNREPSSNRAASQPSAMSAPPVNGSTSGFDGEETLEDVMEKAVYASRQLQAQGDQIRGAQANVRAAKGMAMPKISNATAYTTLSDPLAFESNVDISPISQALKPVGFNLPDTLQVNTPVSDENFATTMTSVVVPVYQGGRVQNMIQAANAAVNAMQAGEQISEQDLKIEAANTYLLVLRVRELFHVANEANQALTTHEQNAIKMHENGLITKNVVLTAEVAHAEAEQNLLKAKNNVQLVEAAYNRLLWRPLQSEVRIAEVSVPTVSESLEELTEQAIHRRPELTALSAKQEALIAQGNVHRANVRPQVALVGAHNYVENSHMDNNSYFTGSVGMAWMPFDGGTSRAQQDASQMEALAVSKLRDDAQTAIELQVYQCWLDEQETRERMVVAEKNVQKAEENFRVVSLSFREGLINHTEVLDAQTALTLAKTNQAHAKYDAILATWKLRRAVGTL